MAETLPPPDDVILETLAKLPVKSLLRFKSVCKTWYSAISDPQFCNKLHRKLPSVLICQNSRKFSTIAIESLLTAKNKTLTRLSLPWETEDPSGDIDPPPLSDDRDRDGNYFLGSCNGLVCVDHRSSGGQGLILWNPSTRKFRRLPRRPSSEEGDYNYYVWFGYDESIHDYKLVWLDYHLSHPGEASKLHVLTLKSNAWRTIDDCRFSGSHRRLCKVDDLNNRRVVGVLSDGAIHWRTATRSYHIVILALDLATENFQELSYLNYPFDPQVGGGSCLVGGCPCPFDRGLDEMSFEMVKEYGWLGIVRPKGGTRLYYPILFSSGKEILGVFPARCQAHFPETYKDRIVKFRIEEKGGEKVSFPETLLWVPNGTRKMSPSLRCKNNIVLHEESLGSLSTYF